VCRGWLTCQASFKRSILLRVLRVLGEHFQDYCGYIVVWKGTVGKGMEAVEEMIQRFGGGLGLALSPEFGHPSGTELDSFGIERFVQAIGGE
jgi:hypothetical protein